MYPHAGVNIHIIDSPVRIAFNPHNYISICSISALGKILTKNKQNSKATSSSLLLRGDYNANAGYTDIKTRYHIHVVTQASDL